MKTLVTLAAILLFTITGWAQGPVRRADTLQQVLAIDPTKVAVGKLSYLVMGRTNVTDGELLLVDFDPTNNLAADNITIFTNVIASGRWVIRPVLASSPLTFQAGTNLSVVVTNNTVTYSYTGTPSLLIDGLPVTEFLDNGYVNFDNGGSGTQYSLYLGDDTISTNKINSTFYNWVLSLAGAGGGTTNGLGVNGTFRTDWNAINSAEIAYTLSAGTNWYASIIAGSIATNKIDTTFRNWILSMATIADGSISTNKIDTTFRNWVLSMSGGSGESNTASNLGTPSSSVIGLYDSKSGVDLRFKSVEAGSNVAITNTGNTVRISAILSTNSGTTVTVDGGSGLSTANFDDGGDINFANSGANVTGTVKADSVALGTDTTGNYIATIAGTANEVTVSGSGSETAAATVSLPATIDLGGKTSFEVPNAAAPTVDAFGEIAGDNDAWAVGRGALLFYDGTAATRVVGVLASDTPSNGQVPKWNTGGTITWEDDNTGTGGSGTTVTANGGSDMTRANLVGGDGLNITQSGTNLTLAVTNKLADGYYAGGFLPLSAGLSNALYGQLHFKKSSDIRVPMWESGTEWNAMGMRASGGVWSVAEYNTNDFTVLESFITIDPTDTTGPTDIITFPNSGFNNKVVFEADVELNGNVIAGTQTLGTSNTTVATTAFVQQNKGGSGSDTNWNGNPIASGTITNLTTSTINGASIILEERGGLFWDFVGAPPFMTALALSSGASFPTTGTTNDPFALIAQTGGSSANSGHGYYTGASSYNVAGGEEWEFGWYIYKTNNVGFRTGLLDVLSATASATDGIYIEQQTNGTYRGVSVSNASLSATASSYVPIEDSTIQYKGTWVVATNPTNIVFTIYTNGVSAWTDTVSANIPTNSARLTGLAFFSWHGGSGSGTNLIKYGWFSFKPTFNGSR